MPRMIRHQIEQRYALETLSSPFSVPLNPSPVYDHSSLYVFRILPKPITIPITFEATGLSYVEVYDADNFRFLLPEKTEISTTTTFNIEWDGFGVFEPRVWKDSNVTKVVMVFTLPEDQEIPIIKTKKPYVFLGTIAIGATSLTTGIALRRKKK